MPAIVCVTVYFEKLRSLATGIAVCGSGFGTVIFAPLTNYLITTFKWQGACLCIAGIVFFCSIFGWMFRPLKEIENEFEEDNQEETPQNNNATDKMVKNDCSDNCQRLLSPNQQIIRSQSIGNELLKNGASNSNNDKHDSNRRLAPSFSQPLLNDLSNNQMGSKPMRTSYSGSGTLDRPDVFYTGSTHNISNHHRSHNSIHSEGEKYGSMRQRNQGREVDNSSGVCGCIPCSGKN